MCAPTRHGTVVRPSRKVPKVKIKTPFTNKKDTPDSGYSKALANLQDALQDVLSLHATEKPAATQPGQEALNASREKQAVLLERVAALAARAASTARNGSEWGESTPSGMQVYRNENPAPQDPIEEGFEFFRISFKQESRAEMVAELYREGQLSMGIYPVEEDRRTFKAMFSRTDGLPVGGEYSWVSGLLHAEPGSWTWDIAEKMRRTCGRAKLDSTKFQKIYRHGATIFIGVKPANK